MPKISAQNLVWARESAGLSLDEAASRILSGQHAAEHLREMERGERDPTRRQLLEMTRVYRRPLLAFYLQEPPRLGARNHDLRTTQEVDTSQEGRLSALIRDARVRQLILQNALEDEEETDPVPVVGSVSYPTNAHALATAMERALNFRIEEYRSKRTIEEAFAFLRDRVERLGIFVLLIGDLGSHHSNVDVRVFRGFSFSTPIAPFIVINDNDSKSAWSFTLLHELAHVFLGESDISGYRSNNATEQLCDKAASRFLLNRSGLEELDINDSMLFDDLVNLVGVLSRRLRVSRTMVAYNLQRIGKISANTYERMVEHFNADRLDFARRGGDRNSRPDYYVVRRHRIGPTLIRTVDRMLGNGSLTTPEAGKVLGVKPTAIASLMPALSLE